MPSCPQSSCCQCRRVRGLGSRPGTLGAGEPGRPVRGQAFRFARNEAFAYVAAFAPVLPAFLLLLGGPPHALRLPGWRDNVEDENGPRGRETGPGDERQAAGGRASGLSPGRFVSRRPTFDDGEKRAEKAAWGKLAEGIVRGDGKPREVRGVGERHTAPRITGMNVHSETQRRPKARKEKTPPALGLVFAPRFDRGRLRCARAPTQTPRRRMSKRKTQAKRKHRRHCDRRHHPIRRSTPVPHDPQHNNHL